MNWSRFSFWQYKTAAGKPGNLPPPKRVLIRSWWSGAWVGHCREWWREGEAQFKALRCKCSNIIYIKLSYLQVYFQHHCSIYSLKSLIEIVLRIFLECPQTYFVTSRGGTQSRPSSVEEITTKQHSFNIDRHSPESQSSFLWGKGTVLRIITQFVLIPFGFFIYKAISFFLTAVLLNLRYSAYVLCTRYGWLSVLCPLR